MESLDGVEDWLVRLSPDGMIVVGALRRLIAEAAPGVREIVYHDALGYGPTDKGFDRVFYPGKKSLIAVAAASLAVSGASPQAVSIVRSRL
jgi:hypothetical protein